ncbi:tail protein [Gordonia phage Herod]|uniref:Minor tail protein n=4 Tax=Nymphadoravirus TaxID=2169636 RepID=A0A142KAQ4_9CAUD|nr:minor tail protein [Gordonia phage Nymphadora]YP_010652893.1 tail protein [Gordonia phage Herod]AOE43868.1 minor tail protein [Gordonia phage BatStarr]QDP43391.1 minor tail protein [Gordonia phage TimTam]AMS03187.1 minor tail protein [Gordonia phage Nymphadora]QOP67331.1 minor tail protein [Gordonia phage Herod]
MSTPLVPDWTDSDIEIEVPDNQVQVIDAPAVEDVEVLVIQGRDGQGLQPDAAVDTYADLPDDLGPNDSGQVVYVWSDKLIYIWSGTDWPAEGAGKDIRGMQGDPGRGIDDVFVVGTSLVFSMSDNTSDDVPVPAIQQAIDSAAAASGSATAADTARLAAEAAASTAGTAASTATTERTAAQTARTAAEAARDTATNRATAASNSADAAATSEANAETSEDNAATSAAAAATSAGQAANRAADADTARAAAVLARDAAAGSATDAATSAGSAQTSADDAGTSAAAAAASAEEAADVVAAGVPDASDTTKGGVRLAGDLGGTWDEPTVPALAMKADLDSNGKLLSSQMPAQATHESVVVTSTAERLALTPAQVQPGDTAIQVGNPGRGTYSLQGADPSDPGSWVLQVAPTDAVSSVNGYQGIVVLGKGDVGLGNVDNTSDLAKPISTAAQTALDGKVDEVATANVAYGTKTGGVQGTWPVTSAATATTLALRGTGGTVAVGTGTAANHATTKQQLDDGLSGKSDTGHAHDAAAIATGTLDAARLPVGTGSTQVAAGNDSRIVNAVPNSRTVTAGTGLSGGGTLDVNRTLSVLYGNTANTATQGNDARLSDTRTPTDNTVSTAKIQDGAVTLAKLATAVSVSIQQMIDASVLAAQLVTINAQTGAYTLVATDANKAVEVTSASAVNITIPTDTVNFPIGTVIEVDQIGAGKVSIVGASGVTVQAAVPTPTTRAQFSALVLRKRAANLWLVTGDLA